MFTSTMSISKSLLTNGTQLEEIEIGNWNETDPFSAIDEHLYKNEERGLSEAKMTTVRFSLYAVLIQDNY